MNRITWSVVVMAAALAACSGKTDSTTASTGAGSTAPSSSTTASDTTVGNGSGTNTTAAATASANSADTSASPAAAVGAPTSTPAAAANSSAATTTADASSASNTGVMGASAGGSGKGQQVFSQTCVACHGAGVAGAPKVGDKADWGPRIAQGQQTLYQHALNGFQGKKGVMPPKGGNTALPDADVKAAVDYMVAQAK